MTPNQLDSITEKMEDIRTGVLTETQGDIADALTKVSFTLAELTSTSKADRDRAKRRIREWKKEAGQ